MSEACLRQAGFATLRMTAAALSVATLFGFFDHGFGANHHYYAVLRYGVACAVGF
jgi:hypothetical protein